MKKSVKTLTFLIVVFILMISCQDEERSTNLSYSLETKLMRSGRIWSLDVSPNGHFIACGNSSGLLRIYDLNSLELTQVLTGFTATINGIHWSPDGQKIVASGAHEDPRVMIWDLVNKTRIILEDHKRQVRSVKWSPKGTHFASTSHDGTIRVWTPEGKLITKFTGANGGCVGIDWLNEDKIAASCWDNTIRTYTISRSDSLLIENGNHRQKAVLSIDWHPKGELLATGDYGNEGDPIHAVKIWTKSGELKAVMESHEKEIRSLAWNPQGDLLASGGKTIRLWNTKGELLKVFDRNSSPVWSLDWNADGSRIVSGHNDGKIRVWNDQGELIGLLNGHSSETTAIAFNKDSTALFVGFSDGIVRFFNLKNLVSTTVQAHNRSVTNIAWSLDQKQIALNSFDGTCSIWQLNDDKSFEKVAQFGEEIYAQGIAWKKDNSAVAYLHDDSKISTFSSSGEFQYTTEISDKNSDAVQWENGHPRAVLLGKKKFQYNDKIVVKKDQKTLELIPLNGNRFALVDTTRNELVYGSKNDFVQLTKSKDGFPAIKPLNP